MTVFNMDIEDGKPPVTFTLKPDDAGRFIAFMDECTGYKKALERIAAYPKTPSDELGYTGCREVAKKALRA
jgi:hypothetical protein